ncbi:MAG: hypothetical protein WD509_00925 [Candidatus Paceibacterota bacterium]
MRIYILLPVLLLITSALIVFGIQLRNASLLNEINFFEQELVNFAVPDIEVDGILYTVERGVVSREDTHEISLRDKNRALKTAYFSVLNRINPLLSLEGTNASAFRHSVADLKLSLNTFAPFYSSRDEAVLLSSFYPIKFLEELSTLEEMRQLVILSPREARIHEYTQQFEKTVTTYKENLSMLSDAYAYASKRWQETDTFYFVGGYTTIAQINTMLTQMETNIESTLQEMHNRTLCIQGDYNKCPALSEQIFPKVTTETVQTQMGALPEEVLMYKEIIKEYYRYDERTVLSSLDTPIVAFKSDGCFWETETSYFFTPLREISPGKIATRRVSLNEIYFYDLSAPSVVRDHISLTNSESPEHLYLYQAIANMYMCPDSSKDASEIITYLYIKSVLSRHPIFRDGNTPQSEHIRVLQEIEKRITSNTEVLYAGDIDQYVETTLKYLRELGGDGALADGPRINIISKKNIFILEKIISLYQSKTANLEGLIYALMDENDFIVREIQNNKRIDLFPLLIARAAPMLTFQGFNRTIHTTVPTMVHKEATVLGESRKYIPYAKNKEMQKYYTLSDLSELMWRSNRLQRPF